MEATSAAGEDRSTPVNDLIGFAIVAAHICSGVSPPVRLIPPKIGPRIS
ncbi:Uncharacterised protein [Mycobacteroides abscessus subsp. massiliense]|nr:Uncharacterised protein [Mycobacteroides abscessus subsp. massiliense]